MSRDGQKNYGVDRFPGRIEFSFMPRGNDQIIPRLLAAQGALEIGLNPPKRMGAFAPGFIPG